MSACESGRLRIDFRYLTERTKTGKIYYEETEGAYLYLSYFLSCIYCLSEGTEYGQR